MAKEAEIPVFVKLRKTSFVRAAGREWKRKPMGPKTVRGWVGHFNSERHRPLDLCWFSNGPTVIDGLRVPKPIVKEVETIALGRMYENDRRQ